MNMKNLPSREAQELVQLRTMLDEVKQGVDTITEASRSLGEMVDLMAVMFENIEQRIGPVEMKDIQDTYRIMQEDTQAHTQ